ncbi:unnamed protein product [Haemonchus placei]|uniref:Glycosyl transferase n=1 Tax=Haemonchus placei TaxID=6290 RepID=A0A0N4WMT2_HAEPC|nr:unnamed protein product [Haemonchus placei]
MIFLGLSARCTVYETPFFGGWNASFRAMLPGVGGQPT